MKKNNNVKNSFFYFYAIILMAILIVSLFLFYSENSKGTLKIVTDDKNLEVLIDGKSVEPVSSSEKVLSYKIKKGSHSIILNEEGYWPWAKKIDIKEKQIIEIFPFFVLKNSSGFIITKNDPEYYKIKSLFWKNTHINWDMDENTPSIIKDFKDEIKASDFYKDRDDVVIIAVQNGIYALEINSDTMPNFQPIYKGKDPFFVKKDNHSLYIKDGDSIMEVSY